MPYDSERRCCFLLASPIDPLTFFFNYSITSHLRILTSIIFLNNCKLEKHQNSVLYFDTFFCSSPN